MQQYFDFLQNNSMLTAAWVGVFIAIIFTSVKAGLSAVKKITHQQATLLMNRENAIVVDVRSEADFKKGHILDAKLLPLSQIKNNELGGLEKAQDTPIIVVCNTGMTSTQACQMLQKAGFTSVHNLQGGISEWKTANLPLTTK